MHLVRGRTLLLVIAGALLLSFAGLFLGLAGCERDEPGRTLVAKGAGPFAHWSKDGQALYYEHGSPHLRRYDLATKKITAYTLPEGVWDGQYDISPDGTAMVFDRYRHGLYRIALATNVVTPLYELTKEEIEQSSRIDAVFWLSQDQVIFVKGPSRAQRAYLIDLADGSMRQLTDRVTWQAFFAADGSGFVYIDSDRHQYRYYNLHTHTDIALDCLGSTEFFTREPKYLSARYFIYWECDYRDHSESVEVLDLTTMTTLAFDLPVTALMQEISPDLTHYFYIDGGRRGSGGADSRLYIMKIPEEMRQMVLEEEQ